MLWGRNKEGKLPASLFCFLILFTPFLQGQNGSIALLNTLADSKYLVAHTGTGAGGIWEGPLATLMKVFLLCFTFPRSLGISVSIEPLACFFAVLEAFLKFPSCMPALSRSLWYSWGGNRDSAIYFSVLAGRSIHSSYLTNVY